ncbi:MAG: hypothetical protein K2X29_07450, partial [Candidatus Obscuribacterales bacterium]|nr:hypothetical protein [Candidatus Obscuribacterales bacterium]
LVSNDTDLVYPVTVVREEFTKDVLLLSPVPNPSPQLMRATTSHFRLDSLNPARHQFANSLTDKKGTITKPVSW